MGFWVKRTRLLRCQIHKLFPRFKHFFLLSFFRLPSNLFIFSPVSKMQWNFRSFLTFFLTFPVQIILKFMFLRKWSFPRRLVFLKRVFSPLFFVFQAYYEFSPFFFLFSLPSPCSQPGSGLNAYITAWQKFHRFGRIILTSEENVSCGLFHRTNALEITASEIEILCRYV